MYEEQINRGIAVLDEKQPGWENRIDLKTLTLSSICHCVVGQLVGNVKTAVWEDASVKRYSSFLMELTGASERMHIVESVNYGFDLDPEFATYPNYDVLTAEWKTAIWARLAENAEVTSLLVALNTPLEEVEPAGV